MDPAPATAAPKPLAQLLRAHRALCAEALGLAQRENESLRLAAEFRPFEFQRQRQGLLVRLTDSLRALQDQHRSASGPRADTADRDPEVGALLREVQDLILKAVLLDRENEQALLRRGLRPAPVALPVPRQRPHFVVDLYRRHTAH